MAAATPPGSGLNTFPSELSGRRECDTAFPHFRAARVAGEGGESVRYSIRDFRDRKFDVFIAVAGEERVNCRGRTFSDSLFGGEATFRAEKRKRKVNVPPTLQPTVRTMRNRAVDCPAAVSSPTVW